MKATDLTAALASVPDPWRDVLPGWTAERLASVQRCIEAVSGDRPIAPEDPFRSLRLVAPADVKVVVIGQDPYPTAGHADGLAFSAAKGRPRSLARVFQILAADRPNSFQTPEIWSLDSWAAQGVLLLNPTLTVEVGRSGSHTECGWQALTVEIIIYLCVRPSPPVLLLWGGRAQAFWASAGVVRGPNVLTTRHPSRDMQRVFMAEGSHFEATAHLVDWWAIGRPAACVL